MFVELSLNFHLISLFFFQAASRLKRKRKSVIDDAERKHIVAMGSINGSITLYDLTSASVTRILENGHSATVTALAWSSSSDLFTAADDHQIVGWNVQDSIVRTKWKSGKHKVTALAILHEGKSLVSADKTIKWWNLATKQLIASFTGHASQVIFLRAVKIDEDTSYLISGASGEGYLSVWSLNEETKERKSAATLTMQDDALSVSARVFDDGQIAILAANRSGQAHIFKYALNFLNDKPLKPALSVVIALDSTQKTAQQIPIQAAELTEDAKLLLAYGSMLNLAFERLTPDFSDNVQCLLRADLKRTKEKKEEAITKVKVAETEGNVVYLAGK